LEDGFRDESGCVYCDTGAGAGFAEALGFFFSRPLFF
jgi:hypothetical protein